MKKTPKEQIEEFIQKHIAKEKDKWAIGAKSDYYAWEDALSDIRSRDTASRELHEALQAYKAFVKDMGLQADFRKWADGKGREATDRIPNIKAFHMKDPRHFID